jgi:hypothetical protein
MMEAASTSETSVNVYQTTRRNNPEDSHRFFGCLFWPADMNVVLYSGDETRIYTSVFSAFTSYLAFNNSSVLCLELLTF